MGKDEPAITPRCACIYQKKILLLVLPKMANYVSSHSQCPLTKCIKFQFKSLDKNQDDNINHPSSHQIRN